MIPNKEIQQFVKQCYEENLGMLTNYTDDLAMHALANLGTGDDISQQTHTSLEDLMSADQHFYKLLTSWGIEL